MDEQKGVSKPGMKYQAIYNILLHILDSQISEYDSKLMDSYGMRHLFDKAASYLMVESNSDAPI